MVVPSSSSRDRLRDRLRKQQRRDPASGSALERLKARARLLHGSKFRFLNEALYTAPSVDSVKLFAENPDNFHIYHEGFRAQVRKWPANPLDAFVKEIGKLPNSLVIGDFGCGDAKLSAILPNPIHSFDLVAVNDRVVACDIAHVPLAKNALDIAVFCLSLMGTNWPDFLREANRVLKRDALLLIGEVRSRIADTTTFVDAVSSLGFRLIAMDDSNVMFQLFRFAKTTSKATIAFDSGLVLKPCLYKKR